MTLTAKEEQTFREMADALQVIPQWRSIAGSEESGAWRVAPGSDFEADNAAALPIVVSLGAWTAIAAAIDHLATLRDSLLHFTGPKSLSAQLHPYGQPSLVRGALENSSRAVWLQVPDSKQERVLRRVQTDCDERRQLMKVAAELGEHPNKVSDKDFEDEMAKLLDRVGADSSKIRPCPGYGEIVKAAGGRNFSKAKVAFVIWKACSALAHGEQRGTIAYLSLMGIDEGTKGFHLNQISPNIELLAAGTHGAIRTTRDAMQLYALRSGTPNPA